MFEQNTDSLKIGSPYFQEEEENSIEKIYKKIEEKIIYKRKPATDQQNTSLRVTTNVKSYTKLSNITKFQINSY